MKELKRFVQYILSTLIGLLKKLISKIETELLRYSSHRGS